MSVPPFSGYPFLQPDPIDSVAHVIQTALTPVFMLSGIGTLLNLFNTRLARVSDHLDDVRKQQREQQADGPQEDGPQEDTARLATRSRRLRRRIIALDTAIIFGGIGGALTCGAALALFLGSLRDSHTAALLIFLFGMALSCVVAALAAFLGDTLLAWHAVHREGLFFRIKAETTQ
ncbi:DUF2721 domain-containing protein [Acidomonas methanolica]|uniref:DUF2721 domain-containing protein n=1 Tax=Acidomonas methanolica NBRC 104435 TaxID=1231351 RepID=A0A023D7Y3_ACIMT|nr:DUF2721 domain-containing protein [Acidomonas methanolica]MBU2655308.1 DUF2721 domain-containing protein [Acidomonas methanolica]TCS23802.1 uncharacterized protein DUF2721 [Acidomonas methanolica]GAJ29855.1 hypothetical protein Amme_083_030 [Acidomonas methanolica NBRC 104435]GBQ53180.1 hypothetical protein AA0498_1890 [Acidomonas methanolica]GEL00204.1 hypothetical protein AME01nite_27020 [Acidomonas methanolica NBRC 104435]